MKVILSQDIPNLGKKDEVKEVADGYGRNFLIPQGLARMATQGELEKLALKRAEVIEKEKKRVTLSHELKERIEKLSLIIERKATKTGKLYAGVTPKKIAKDLEGYKISVDEKKIKLAEPIKKVGEYEAIIELKEGMKANLKILIKAK